MAKDNKHSGDDEGKISDGKVDSQGKKTPKKVGVLPDREPDLGAKAEVVSPTQPLPIPPVQGPSVDDKRESQESGSEKAQNPQSDVQQDPAQKTPETPPSPEPPDIQQTSRQIKFSKLYANAKGLLSNLVTASPPVETEKEERLSPEEKAKSKWFYRVEYEMDEGGRPCRILMEANPNREKLTVEALDLIKDIEAASIRISKAFNEYDDERIRMFELLKDVAKTGLCGEKPDLELARIYFDSFKNMVPTVSDKVRRKFINSTIRWNIFASILAILTYLTLLSMHSAVFSNLEIALGDCDTSKQIADIASKNPNYYCKEYPTSWGLSVVTLFYPEIADGQSTRKDDIVDNVKKYSSIVMGYTLAIVGGSIGLILLGFLRNRKITWETFDSIYQYGMKPHNYLMLIMILALVVMIMVVLNVFTLGVGSIILNDVVTEPQNGLIIGLLCSISEPLISSMVINQMKLANGVEKEQPPVGVEKKQPVAGSRNPG